MDHAQGAQGFDQCDLSRVQVAKGLVAFPNIGELYRGFLPIASHNLNVSFLRNGNHFPDSGPLHAALHEAEPDPNLPLVSDVAQGSFYKIYILE